MRSFDEVFTERKSVRRYTGRPIGRRLKETILAAAMRAPTAGNLMLYSIIEVDDPAIKRRLSVTCDNQPFIAQAPWVLVFLADFQRMMDCYALAGAVPRRRTGQRPREADLLLACCDALVAAQTAVVAAEAHGVGSCYIGDIVENYETHRDLLHLPRYAFPIAMVCFGFPTGQQKTRPQTTRFPRRIVVHSDSYKSITRADMEEMYQSSAEEELRALYTRKFTAEFSAEARRSVKKMLEDWR
jgi:FMN reductase (NADPH)/FMN reductase [NAD(P)H]